MKKKKILATILILILSLVCCFSMAGCEVNRVVDRSNLAVFMFQNGETVESIDIDTTKFKDASTLYDVMKSSDYATAINADIAEGSMPYINSIHGISPSLDAEKHEFIAIYSTLEEYKVEGFTKTVNEIIFYSCKVGIGEMPLVKGATYLFCIGTW